MYYVPIHKEWYYEVIITDIKVNGDSLNMDCEEVTVKALKKYMNVSLVTRNDFLFTMKYNLHSHSSGVSF